MFLLSLTTIGLSNLKELEEGSIGESLSFACLFYDQQSQYKTISSIVHDNNQHLHQHLPLSTLKTSDLS